MSGDITSNSLQAGFIELASVVRALHGNWGSPTPGYDGWTCRDLLAHLSSTAASLPAVASSATEPKDPNAPEFDADRWNRGQVRRRADKEPQELIDEYDAGTTRLVAVLSDITLDAVVTIGPFAGDSVGESMAKMLQHQRSHLTDLEAALSPPA